MITGTVNQYLTPMVSLEFYSATEEPITFPVVVDTGFNGEIGMPLAEIRRLGLQRSNLRPIPVQNADGQVVYAPLYIGKLTWLENIKEVVVVCLGGEILLGMGLLTSHKVTIENRVITIE